MIDPKKRLQDAFAKEREPKVNIRECEDTAREDAIAFFEQTISPGFEAAAGAINEEPTRRAEVMRSLSGRDVLFVDLTVRHSGRSELVYRVEAGLRPLPISWTFKRSPTVRRDGTLTLKSSKGTMKWKPSKTETTVEQVRDDLLSEYTKIIEAQN